MNEQGSLLAHDQAASDTGRVYRPDSRADTGLFAAIDALARELSTFRSHIGTLFWNDFRASYRGAALGVFWNFILPLVPVSVYVLLVNLRVFPTYEGLDPALYIAFNVTLWSLFTGLINQPIQIVRSRNTEVMKTAMPLSASIAASFARLCFDTSVRAVLIVILMLATTTAPTILSPAVLLVIAGGGVFFLGLGLFLSVANVIYPDIERVVSIILQYGVFLSGVIFPLSSVGPFAPLETLNPFNVFIHAARDAVFLGAFTQPVALACWSAAGLLVALIAARFFYVLEYRIRGLA